MRFALGSCGTKLVLQSSISYRHSFLSAMRLHLLVTNNKVLPPDNQFYPGACQTNSSALDSRFGARAQTIKFYPQSAARHRAALRGKRAHAACRRTGFEQKLTGLDDLHVF